MSIKTRIALNLATLCIALALVAYLTDNTYVFRAFVHTYLKGHSTANIYDYQDVDNRVIATKNPQAFELHEKYNQIELPKELKHKLKDYQSVAYLILKDGKLLHESYYMGHTQDTLSNSFSMAKTLVTLMVLKAIKEGHIKSLEQPITDFLPEYKNDANAKLATVGDLAAMQSGYDWIEDYWLPINPTSKAYYGKDLEQQILSRPFSKPPKGEFQYSSGSTQLLGILLQRAVGMSLSEYLSSRFWQPLQMQADAYWSLDANATIEKAYCCINASARDFARLGQFVLNKGSWGNQSILSVTEIDEMLKPNTDAFKNKSKANYGLSIWIDTQHQPNFYAFLGHLGQRIIIIPDKNMVIVRLGHKKHTDKNNKRLLDTDVYYFLDGALKLNQQLKN